MERSETEGDTMRHYGSTGAAIKDTSGALRGEPCCHSARKNDTACYTP